LAPSSHWSWSGCIRPADREVVSAFIGKPLPAFDLPPASDDRPGLATAQFKQGKPRLLNVFASWCVPCAVEAPQLAALVQQGVEIDGVALRDRKDDLARFLVQNGNPFTRSARMISARCSSPSARPVCRKPS